MLTREFLQSGGLQDLVRQGDPTLYVLSDDELQASRQAILADWNGRDDVWVFGYGSLIWNPAFHFAEKALGKIYGHHRAFCLWVYLGRGSREQPGLMLGLRPGGATRGLAYRIEAASVEEELTIVWRREMVTAAYVPRWVTIHTDNGPVKGIAFVINANNDRFADGLSQEQTADYIAKGRGFIGTSADYLFSTVDHLRELDICDRRLTELASRVKQKLVN
ncbi:MAG: gamma-glutamylcyclotransferase [Pseudomonadota bacterium]